MTCSSSPKASSSTDDRVTRCCGPLPNPQRSVREGTFADLRDDVPPLTDGYELALFRWV